MKELFSQKLVQPMKSVKVNGIVRISGNTVTEKNGRTVFLQDEPIQKLRLKNIQRRGHLTVSYTANRKRITCTLKPKEIVNIDFPFSWYGKKIEINNWEIEFRISKPDDKRYCLKCNATVIQGQIDCPHCWGRTEKMHDEQFNCLNCNATLERDELGYCPHCGQ